MVVPPTADGFCGRRPSANLLKLDSFFHFGYGDWDENIPVRELDYHAVPRRVPVVQVPVQVALPVHLAGANLFHPETRGWRNQVRAVEGRLGCHMPQPDRALLRRLRTWSLLLARTFLQPLRSGHFSDELYELVEHWLEQTHYPNPRKRDLRGVVRSLPVGDRPHVLKRVYSCSGHVKSETYVEPKIPRGIHPEGDEVKVIMGPIFKEIENVVYMLPQFIKHIPVKDHAAYILQKVASAGMKYFGTDFSSFEASFSPELRRAIEHQLYKYILRNNPLCLRVMEAYEALACGRKTIRYKHATMVVDGRRLSGEMCTSLGNTWTNFVLLTFCLSPFISPRDMRVLVEGDDGLFAADPSWKLDFTLFERLGFKVKMVEEDKLSEVSFCGLVADEEDGIIITEPLSEIAGFGWTSGQNVFADKNKRDHLLCAKAMSLAYQYQGCPILQSLARLGLRVTRHVHGKIVDFIKQERTYNEWERPKLIEAAQSMSTILNVPIKLRTRLLMERLYGVTVADQLRAEARLDAINKPGPFTLDLPFPEAWRRNYHARVAFFTKNTPWSRVSASRPTLL